MQLSLEICCRGEQICLLRSPQRQERRLALHCSQTLEDLLRCCRTRRNPGQFCSGLASKSHCSRPPIDACACLQDGDSSVAVAQSGHTMLECCTPVAFVTMPAGSSDSLCYDLSSPVRYAKFESIRYFIDIDI